jgi:fumarylacetoacetase
VSGGPPEPAARIAGGIVPLRTVEPRLESLNELIERGPRFWEEVRHAAEETGPALALDEAEPVLPVAITDYVDCYASLEHATNVGRLFRPDEPLQPNWRRLPVAYHGRASTVVVSGTDVVRPHGQVDGHLRPTHALDFECELGFVCGPSTRVGERVPIDEAADRIFGFVLLNDWSARDVQAFEYVPLGPFLGKSFATSISPWIVPRSELERVAPREQEPHPDAYLCAQEPWTVDLEIEVAVDDEVVARCNPRWLYWTPAQMLAHATVNGASLTAGDLIGTGTISGTEPDQLGCLLEQHRGDRWLADGEDVVMRSDALGEVRGRVLPADR